MSIHLCCAVSAALVSASLAAAQPLIAHFDFGIEGWTIETHTNPAAAFTLVGVYSPDYIASGGDRGRDHRHSC